MLKPLQDNVIIKPLETETVTSSGIITQVGGKSEKPMKGEVIAIGPGKTDKPMDGINIGDTVYFSQYAPTEVKYNNEEYYIAAIDSILAVA